MKIWKCWFQKNTTFDDIWCTISWIQFIIISPTGELPWLPSPLGLDAGSSELLMSSDLFFTCKVRNPWNPCITRLEPAGLIINHHLSFILRIKIAILGGIPMFKHPNAHVDINVYPCFPLKDPPNPHGLTTRLKDAERLVAGPLSILSATHVLLELRPLSWWHCWFLHV